MKAGLAWTENTQAAIFPVSSIWIVRYLFMPCHDEGWVPKTGAMRTETQRAFRRFLSVPEPIETEKNYYFELLW